MKNLLTYINPNIKAILSQGVMAGMQKGSEEVSTNQIYSVGIGCDNKQRQINVQVNFALQTAILAVHEPGLSVKTIKHRTGHSLEIVYGRFIIYPKRVDFKNPDYEEEPDYHKQLIVKNPTKQNELFAIYTDPDRVVLVQLLFGMDQDGFFAILRIPDSSGAIYEEEALKLKQPETLAPEEKVRTSRKLRIRSEKVSGNNA
jgi:hypothetical protein